MEFRHFIDNHWDVFVNHICRFHRLQFEFLSEYEYELDWKLISKNRAIHWTVEILENFEDRFLWHELAWNESITWDSSLINQFKKRLDWYYLGRNTNLPISEQFIKEHRKNIFIIETNTHLTDTLKQIYGKELLPDVKPKVAPITSLTDGQLDELEDTFKDSLLMKNTFENLYTEFILPNLNETSVEALFKNKFDCSQRYFKLKPIGNDVHGLTPEFKVDGENVFGEFRKGRGFFDIPNSLKLINGSLQEGPPRLYEIPRFSDMSFYPVLLISQNIKSIIETFNCANHKFIPVQLSPKKITTDLQFYLFQMEYDSLLKNADFSELQFERLTKADWFGEYESKHLEIGEIKDYESIKVKIDELQHQGVAYSKFKPLAYEVDTVVDIFTVELDIIVNEFVKNAIETILPNQVLFESAQDLNIKIPQEAYEQKKKKSNVGNASIKSADKKMSKEYIFYLDKSNRLKKENLSFSAPIPHDEFYRKQRELNVIFSEAFKSKYRNGKTNTDEFEWLAIDEFYLQNEYADRNPETYKSVIVAENGCGDSLGLILQKDDDFRLGDELYEFYHETGEVEKY